MCLAVPGKVISVNGDNAVVDYICEKREAGNLIKAEVGDYVIVQAKMVVSKVDKQEGEAALKAFNNI